MGVSILQISCDKNKYCIILMKIKYKIYEKRVQTEMVNNFIKINKTNLTSNL